MNVKYLLELFFWLGALFSLALSDPAAQHFSLCPLFNLGISWCPGCGLGRALSSLLHLDFAASLRHHWFGIPAFFILLNRIGQLSRKFR